MSKLLFWPSKYHFYPIGNTSAVSLTGDLPPEEPARLLLLGCGDPRNVLFTIFGEPEIATRTLDFTCCDFDPAVLARNVLLFTMIIDEKPFDLLWNTFFHFRIEKKTRSGLIAQCNKLIELSESLDSWSASEYGQRLRMCTKYTLSELRRHWRLYVDMSDLPEDKLKAIHTTFKRFSTENAQKTPATILRSTGPLIAQSVSACLGSFPNFWKTGTTFTDARRIADATEVNPTFVYSLGDDVISFHYGTDPLIPFHLAPVLANAKRTLGLSDITDACREQFKSWCNAYRASQSSKFPPFVRFFVGDAISTSHALRAYNSTGAHRLGIPVAQWKTTLISLDPEEYVNCEGLDCAPSSFNVIHTSNLEDHIGLLNVLISSIPILSPSPFSTIYSESILFLGKDATKEVAESLKADITVIGLLAGVVPVDYLCGFASRSNTHEILLHQMTGGFKTGKKAKGAAKEDNDRKQFHQMTTWKMPTSGDLLIADRLGSVLSQSYDSHQLGTLLYDIYQEIFDQETSSKFWEANKNNYMRAFSASNLAHYTREAFVHLLKIVRMRIGADEEEWGRVMERFMSLQLGDWHIMSMDTLHYQDFCGQLLRHGVHRLPFFLMGTSKTGPFSSWAKVPPLVRIVMSVPRHKLSVLEHSKAEEIGTPPLHCDIFGMTCHNIFSSVHVAFGRASKAGTKTNPSVVFEEDTRGWKGTSPLVVSFVAPSWLLVDKEPPQNLSIGFGVRNTPAACMTLIPKLGMELRIFSAKLMDENHVFVLPEHPLPSRYSLPASITNEGPANANSPPPSIIHAQLGSLSEAFVALDEQCELVTVMTVRITLTDADTVAAFSAEGSKVLPEINQISACVIRVSIADKHQDLVFPFPVQGSANRMRLARKSKYIEVIVPPSRSFLPEGMKLNPYPVISAHGVSQPWSIPRLNLEKLPILSRTATNVATWFNTHLGSTLSTRERSMRKKNKQDAIMYVKDTIHSMFIGTAGTQQKEQAKRCRLFCLRDEKTNNSDTIFFINCIRFDLASHTLVCDAYVLPLTVRFLQSVSQPFGQLVNKSDLGNIPVYEGEMQSWKQLLPALVERCRTTWTHGPNCEYKAKNKIPLTEAMEENPLCSCGAGKNVDGMEKVELWKPFAPYVTRIALSPLFAVSYLETVGRSPETRKCARCRRKGNPHLKECSACQQVRYCSPACQKADWKRHKPKCKGSSGTK
ncbi:hypothetical protein BKA70DRAFT_1171851 [Coprinopsis sp. MPI-PUGE-AT-0042]|nr:hypothetical protein BKA70DRAFT_1171851 [Coprinopsis sp. MPI-PUGE-AT-0042]